MVLFCLLTVVSYGQQQYPKEVQTVLDNLKQIESNKLNNFRLEPKEYFCFELMYKFLYPDTLFKKAEKCNLTLGVLYDEEMRNRIIQLLTGEITATDMDSVDSKCKRNSQEKYTVMERERKAFMLAKIDTVSAFRAAMKNLYEELTKENQLDQNKKLGKFYEINMLKKMKLDTLNEYKIIYSQLIYDELSECKKEYIDYFQNSFNYSVIARLSGYIGDKRFVKPLIAALKQPEHFNEKTVIEALVRMKVEPYYTQYIKARTRNLDMVKKEVPEFKIEEFADVVRSQESFREISKYLLSPVLYYYHSSGKCENGCPVSNTAFFLIKNNIENTELQKLVSPYGTKEDKKAMNQIYEWMQKNYGKYKIKKIW